MEQRKVEEKNAFYTTERDVCRVLGKGMGSGCV